MSNISHFMNGRDAFVIAKQTHDAIMSEFDYSQNGTINGSNVDALNNYYSLMMHFTIHNDFIDSCAFDSMVELDNFIELMNSGHEIVEWDIDAFESHYKNDIRTLHHYNSLRIHNMDAIHNREICSFCNVDFESCCETFESVAPVAFTMMDIIKAI